MKSANKSGEILKLLIGLYKDKTNNKFIVDDTEESYESIISFIEYVVNNIVTPMLFEYESDPSILDTMDADVRSLIIKLAEIPKTKLRLYYGVHVEGILQNIAVGAKKEIVVNDPLQTDVVEWTSNIHIAWHNAGFSDTSAANNFDADLPETPNQLMNSSGYVVYRDFSPNEIEMNLGKLGENIKLGLEKIFRIIKKFAKKHSNDLHRTLTAHSLLEVKNPTIQYEPDDEDMTDNIIADVNIRRSIKNLVKTWIKHADTINALSDDFDDNVLVNGRIRSGIVHSFFLYDQQNILHYGPEDLAKNEDFKDFISKV